MAHPDMWPRSYVLPLSREGYRGRDAAGDLLAPSARIPCPPPEPVVYLGNISDPTPYGERARKRCTDLDAILDDGWRINLYRDSSGSLGHLLPRIDPCSARAVHWTVRRYVGGMVWCARRRVDHKLVLNASSAEDLAEMIEAAGAR
jgi:hypothetical protein